MYKQGFVFGKYYPLHNGHLDLMRYAKGLCKHLTILVCASNKEPIPGEQRADWLRKELAGIANITVISFDYDETLLPNTSQNCRDISQIWSGVFKNILPHVDLLVTWELYGNFVAEFMGITHIAFNQPQLVSSSRIRKNTLALWEHLPASVKQSLQKVIVICGAESIGKTVMAERLASAYNAPLVVETAGKIIKNPNDFSKADLYRIAEEHAAQIASARASLAPLIFVDTDIYTTQSYAHLAFGEYLELPPEIYTSNHADLRLYFNSDMAFSCWQPLDALQQNTLACYQQEYELISGNDWEQQFTKAKNSIDNMIFGYDSQI